MPLPRFFVFALTLLGCAPLEADGGPSAIQWPSGSADFLFQLDTVHEFDIELSEDAWTMLAKRGRQFVPATFRFADWELPVGLRIKGQGSFRGLESGEKSAFKVDFNHEVADGEFFGLHKLTLNNMLHDPSLSGEAVGYKAFEMMGLPRPRVAYARVRLNGEDRGLYLVLEPMDERRFLERHFGNATGNVYEGSYTLGEDPLRFADFLLDRYELFEHDRRGSPTERLDLRAFSEALATSKPAQIPTRLDHWLDLDDNALPYLAAEIFLSQWDGYAGNSNNFKVYYDPSIHKFLFMPWGIDSVLKTSICRPDGCARDGRETPGIVFQRVWDDPGLRERYLEALRAVMASLAGDELLAYQARVQALIAAEVDTDPYLAGTADTFEAASNRLRHFLHERPTQLRNNWPN